MSDKFMIESSDDNSSSSLTSSISSLSVGSDATISSHDSILDPPLASIVEDINEDDNNINNNSNDINKISNYSDNSSIDDDVDNLITKFPEKLSLIKEDENININNNTINNNLNTSGKYELGPHQPKNQRDIDKRSIYVSNIPFKISPWKLKQLFSEGTDKIKGCGEKSVNRVTILCDRFTGLPKGYAYIEFANEDAVNNALNFNNIEIDGRIIGVVPKRTNVPYINESLNSFQYNNKFINNLNNFPYHLRRKDNKNGNKHVNRCAFNDNNNDNNNNKNNNNNNNYDNNYSRDNITQDNKNNKLNKNFNTNNYSNNNTGFNKYKRNFSNLTPHSNSNYVFMNGQGRVNNKNQYNYRGYQKANHNNNNNNNNNNINNNNYGKIKNGSNFQLPSKPSKLIIDNNHYLTPSSRVGVYNNINED